MVMKEHRLSASLAMASQQGPHKMEGESGGLHVRTSNGPGLEWGVHNSCPQCAGLNSSHSCTELQMRPTRKKSMAISATLLKEA